MALLLRGIEKRRWNREEAKNFHWLLSNDCPADPLADLRTQKNALSFWYIEEDRSNLERVAIAIACTKGNLDNLDYAIIDIRFVEKIGIQVLPNPGDTPDTIANSWHRDLIEVSASKLASLAQTMWNQIEPQRISQKDILEGIVAGVVAGELVRAKIKITSDALLRRLDAL